MNYKAMMDHKPHVVSMLRLRAARGLFNGQQMTMPYLESCRYFHKKSGAMLIFTRDTGYHSGGWWKNPDYERCYHLSLSFKGIEADMVYSLPRSRKHSEEWITAFFGEDKKLLWVEPPYTRDGKVVDVWHYRLFCDESWTPIKPSGEVYSKLDTPAGWLSFSDLKYKLSTKN